MIQGPDGQDYVVVTVTDISEQKRVEEQLRERQREIDADPSTAARIQQSLAPHNLAWKDLAVEAHYSPARTIGGDFGIVLPQGDEFLNLILCDVSGHGVASALMANRIYSETLHALERKTEPSRLLQCLHDFVHDRIPQNGFYFTMTAARFSQCGRRMTFAAACQPPAILVSKGTLRGRDRRGHHPLGQRCRRLHRGRPAGAQARARCRCGRHRWSGRFLHRRDDRLAHQAGPLLPRPPGPVSRHEWPAMLDDAILVASLNVRRRGNDPPTLADLAAVG